MTEKKPHLISYLSFKLGKEVFAVNVHSTIKILQYSSITNVPQSPPNMKGVINNHGSVLPVFDLSQTLGLKGQEINKNTCILILSIKGQSKMSNVGAIVDEVLSVEDIPETDIKPPPSTGNKNNLPHIKGVFSKNDDFVMILDVDSVFASIDL